MYHIGVIPGDGNGPELIEQGLRVLAEVASRFDIEYRLVRYPFGAAKYFEDGSLVSEADIADLRSLDALLMGVIGDTRLASGFLEQKITARLCSDLELSLHVQHVRLYNASLCPIKGKKAEDVDLVMVRENAGDYYSDLGGFVKKGLRDEIAFVQGVFTRAGVERTLRYAYDLARERPRHHLTLVDRSDLVSAHDLWRRVYTQLAADYPDVQTASMNADEATSVLVTRPEWFDVLVLTNVIGDLLMPIGSQLQGGFGFGAAGYLNPGEVSMFAPVFGSASASNRWIEANPIGTILAVARMLESIGQNAAAQCVEDAVKTTLENCDVSMFSPENINTSLICDILLRNIGRRHRVVY